MSRHFIKDPCADVQRIKEKSKIFNILSHLENIKQNSMEMTSDPCQSCYH